MRLDAARLCLDCEEVHEAQICPVCSSEVFVYLTRWVQPSLERHEPRAAAEPSVTTPPARTPEQIEAYRQIVSGAPPPRRRAGIMTGGVLGLAAVSLAGWALRSSLRRRVDGEAAAKPDPAVSDQNPPRR